MTQDLNDSDYPINSEEEPSSSSSSLPQATASLLQMVTQTENRHQAATLGPFLEYGFGQIDPWVEDPQTGWAVVDLLMGATLLPSQKAKLFIMCAKHPSAPDPSTWKDRESFIQHPTQSKPITKPWPHVMMKTTPSMVSLYTKFGGSIRVYDENGLSALSEVHPQGMFLDAWFKEAQKEEIDLLFAEGDKSWQEYWSERNKNVSVSEFSALQKTLNELRKKYPVVLPAEVVEKQNRKEFLRTARKLPGKSVLHSTAKLLNMDVTLCKDALFFEEMLFAMMKGFTKEVNFSYTDRGKHNYALTSLKLADTLFEKHHKSNPQAKKAYDAFRCFFHIAHFANLYVYADPLKAWLSEKSKVFKEDLKHLNQEDIRHAFLSAYEMMKDNSNAPIYESLMSWQAVCGVDAVTSLEMIMERGVELSSKPDQLDWLHDEMSKSKRPLNKVLLGEQLMMFAKRFSSHAFYLGRSSVWVETEAMSFSGARTQKSVLWDECLEEFIKSSKFNSSDYEAIESSKSQSPLVAKMKSMMEKQDISRSLGLDGTTPVVKRKMKL